MLCVNLQIQGIVIGWVVVAVLYRECVHALYTVYIVLPSHDVIGSLHFANMVPSRWILNNLKCSAK